MDSIRLICALFYCISLLAVKFLAYRIAGFSINCKRLIVDGIERQHVTDNPLLWTVYLVYLPHNYYMKKIMVLVIFKRILSHCTQILKRL